MLGKLPQSLTFRVGTETMLLGVNIDHVATLRQARGTEYPVPLEAAKLALASGADADESLARALDDHHQILDAHLQLEEDLVIPLLLALSPEEFQHYYDSPWTTWSRLASGT